MVIELAELVEEKASVMGQRRPGLRLTTVHIPGRLLTPEGRGRGVALGGLAGFSCRINSCLLGVLFERCCIWSIFVCERMISGVGAEFLSFFLSLQVFARHTKIVTNSCMCIAVKDQK